jgi:protein-S-isoprenylcysteine O-methyltransferase Ste14
VRLLEYLILALGWFLWFIPLARNGWHWQATATRDNRARWGILIQMAGYALLWQGKFWMMPPEIWRIALSILFFTLAFVLSWTGARALGRHLQLDAAIKADHQLVQSGPYRLLRHPIYTSMLCLLLGTGIMITSWLLFLCAIAVFAAGTEVRVRIEDRLLESRFGGQFDAYRQAVAAYVPFLR